MKLGILLILLAVACECKVFTRCKLAKALDNVRKFSKVFLPSYVCIAEKSVKTRDTSVVTEKKSKKYYGLFQIPQEYCKETSNGGLCGVKCSSLLDDDIEVATRCAESIVNDQGFKFWSIYEQCKNQLQFYVDEIYRCPEMQGRSISLESDEEVVELPSRHGLRSPKRSEILRWIVA